MNAKFSFLKGVSVGLVALGIALGHSASGYAAATTKTWTGSVGSGGVWDWSTAGNWNTSGAPANGDSANFGAGAANRTITINSDTAEMQNLNFSANDYSLVGGRFLKLRAGAVITNTGTNTQIQKINALGNFSVTGAGTLSILSDIKASAPVTLSVNGGSKVVLSPNFSPSNGTVNVNSNAGEVQVAGYYTLGEINQTVSASTVSGYGDGVNYSKGTVDSLVLGSAGTTKIFIGDSAASGKFDQFTSTDAYGGSGNTTFGGALDLNFLAPFVPANQTYNLFKTQGAGALYSNFDSISNTVVGAQTVSWTNNLDGTWTSQGFGVNGQYMIFDANLGNLVVVPEPSTIVFAGVGVAMAGWSAWKKRRLAKA